MTAAITMTGIGRTYGSEPPVTALTAVDLSIEAGEHVAITGASGSGKSTMLNVMGLLDRPDRGTYALAGVDTTAMDERTRTAHRAHHVGFVFQAFHLLPGRTVEENVAVGLIYQRVRGRLRDDAVSKALETVGLAHRRTAHARTLSGGEAQRVAIARAIAGHPTIVLADEPTGNLDTPTSRSVLATLEGLRADSNTTLVVVTHDEAVARRADRVVRIADGRVAA